MGFVNGKLLALILCAGLLLSLCACGGSTRDYEGEIRLLKEENVALQEQVRQLEEQLDRRRMQVCRQPSLPLLFDKRLPHQ